MWASSANAPWVDKFYDRATALTMTAVATTIPVGTTEEAFIDAYLKPAGPAPTCIDLAKDMPRIVIDGHPARETTKCGDQAGFVAQGGTVSDNCGGTVTITHTDATNDLTCPNKFTITRTYMQTDSCSNSSTCAQTITVTAPLE